MCDWESIYVWLDHVLGTSLVTVWGIFVWEVTIGACELFVSLLSAVSDAVVIVVVGTGTETLIYCFFPYLFSLLQRFPSHLTELLVYQNTPFHF